MARVLPHRSPTAEDERTAWVGMVIFLGSWAMMFAALFYSYGVLRTAALVWPPLGVPRIPLGLPAVNTALVILSSLCLLDGIRQARAGAMDGARSRVFLAVVLGAAFLALQWMVWRSTWDEGLRPGSGPYGSVFWGLTVVHAIHVAVGLVALARIAIRGLLPSGTLSLRLWSMYWHFVGVVWVLLFLLVYLP